MDIESQKDLESKSLESLSDDLKSLSREELVELVLSQHVSSQQQTRNPRLGYFHLTPMVFHAPSEAEFSWPKPSPPQAVGLFLLLSLGIHGLLFFMAITTPTAQQDPDLHTLIPPTELIPSPTDVPELEPKPSALEQAIPAASPPQTDTGPIPGDSIPPLFSPPAPLAPESSTPETAEVEDTAEEWSFDLKKPEDETPKGPTEISGVPVSPDWFLLKQFQDLRAGSRVAEADWYGTTEGQFRDEILGILRISDQDFEAFWPAYQQQLKDQGFRIISEGRVGGALLYQLTPRDQSRRLYLSIEPLEGESEIVLAIWSQYPW